MSVFSKANFIRVEIHANAPTKFSSVSTDPRLNSSLILHADRGSGLTMTQFISNSTDVLASLLPYFANPDTASLPWHAQIIPTLLYENQTALEGELWRSLIVIDQIRGEPDAAWDDFCITNVDLATYAEVPLNKMIFWRNDDSKIDKVELPAFHVTLKRTKESMTAREGSDADLVVQM